MKKLICIFGVIICISINSCKNACDDYYCFNGGTCTKGTCNCKPGYGGTQCDILLDSCMNVTCGTHQHCVAGICVCDSGWGGTLCQTLVIVDPCANVICGAHSIYCSNGICICEHGWGGIKCDTNLCSITDCGLHGVCVDGVCHCDPNWTGTHCENQIAPIDSFAGNYHMYGYRTYWGSYSAPTDTIDAVVTVTKTNELILRIYGNDLVFTTTAVGADPAHGYTYFCTSCSNGDDMSRLVFPKPLSDTVIFTNSGGPASGGYNTNLTGIKIH